MKFFSFFKNIFFKLFIIEHAYNIRKDYYLYKKYGSFFLENNTTPTKLYDVVLNDRKFRMLSKKDKKRIKKDIVKTIEKHIYNINNTNSYD